MLIIISLSNEELNIRELNRKYNNVLNSKIIKNNSTLVSFDNLIKRMDNEFTVTYLEDADDILTIKFKNPSYKDFMYEYLENNMVFYISYIYNEYLDLDELINLWSILNRNFELYKDLNETIKIDETIYNKLVNMNINTKYASMIALAEVTDFNYSTKIRNYLISFMETSLTDIDEIMFYDSDHYQLVFALLTSLVKKYDFSKYIYDLLYDIVFNIEELFFVEKITIIKELYPDIYKGFYKEYSYSIRQSLIYSIKNMMYYYQEENDLDGLYFLKEEDIVELYRKLNIKVPSKLIKEIDSIINDLEKENVEDKFNYGDYSFDTSFEEKKQELEQEDSFLVNYKIKELIGSNEYISNIDDFFKKWDISSSIKEKILKIKDNEILGNMVYYEKTLYILCQFFIEKEYSDDCIDLLESFVDYLIKVNMFNKIEVSTLENLISSLIMSNKVVFKKEDIKKIYFINDDNIDKVINSSFFIKRGEWYHFIHPILQNFIFLKLSKRAFKNSINLESVLYYLDELDWDSVDFFDHDMEIDCKLIEKIFPVKWNEEVKIPLYSYFIKKINKKDDIEIAKSILRMFDLYFDYRYGANGIIYRNGLLCNLLKIDFNVDIIDLLNSNLNDMFGEVFPEIFIDNDNVLEINKYLRRKRFVNLLIESGIVDKLNNLYNEVLLKVSNELVSC